MVTYEKFVKKLIANGIDKTIVEKLIDEYRIVKREHLRGDHEKVILHSARLAELILALIKNNASGEVININDIHFNKLLEEIRNYHKSSAEEVIFTLAIPRVAESIYTIRSKKDVVHIKTIDPSFIDSSYCVSACDWILSELTLLFLKTDPKEARELINSILRKKIPTIEEFENGSIVILRKDLSVKQEIMLILYYYYPNRVFNTNLTRDIKATPNQSYVNRLLNHLENQRFIHRSEKGYKLTKLGIEFVEDILVEKTE